MNTAAIANDGVQMKPYLEDQVFTANLTLLKEGKPEQLRRSITTSTAERLTNMMVSAVSSGVSSNARIPGVKVAGKTGTAQVFGKNPNGSAKDDTSWFASYGPTNDPQYAVVMMVSQGGFGASTSGIGVKDIYTTLFGVTGNKVDPEKVIFPNGVPSTIAKVDLKQVAKKVDLTGVKVGGVKLK